MERNLKKYANEFVTSPLLLLFFSNKKYKVNVKVQLFSKKLKVGKIIASNVMLISLVDIGD